MRRANRRTNQILFWGLSLIVVLSMIGGLVASVMPQPCPPVPAAQFSSFFFAVSGEPADNDARYRCLLQQVAEDGNFFLVHTGDLTSDGSVSSFQRFASRMADFPLPFYPVPGDRDHYRGVLDNFLRYSGARGAHYAFDYEAVHFAVVNSDLGRVTPEELAWLREDLMASERPVKMVFLHYPPFVVADNEDVMRSGGGDFMALMEEQGVDYVFAGHIQGYHVEEREGVRYIIAGRSKPSTGQDSGEGGFYVRVTVQGVEVTVEVIPIEA